MSQNCSSNYHEKLNNVYFRELFNKTKIPKKYKSLGRRMKEREISQKDYDSIISLYMDIFYNEVYFINKPSYFFLGGFIEKLRTKPGVRTIKSAVDGIRPLAHAEFPITLMWDDLFFLNSKEKQIYYNKMNGKRTRTLKIEQEWKRTNNYYDLREYENVRIIS